MARQLSPETSRRQSARPGSSLSPNTAASGSASNREAQLADKLLHEQDIHVRLSIASEIRDSVETLNREAEYKVFVDNVIPAVMSVLRDGPVSVYSATPEHKLRMTLMEALHRLNQSEPLKPHAPELMALLLYLLRNDNEDVASVAMKTIIDLHRAFKDVLSSTVDEFFTIVKDYYRGMDAVVANLFPSTDIQNAEVTSPKDTPATPGNSLSASGSMQPANTNTPLPIATQSFKVISECPIAIVFLFQTYREVVPQETKIFVPIIFNFLQITPAAQFQAHQEAEARGEIYTDVAPALESKRGLFNDLLNAQVKTMSFVAYVLRVAFTALNSYRTVLPSIIVRLMKDMSTEAVATRKELIVAHRHILATDFRAHFIPYIDVLLDDRVLIGTSTTSNETLRQTGYSTMADMIHHVRAELNIEQISRVIHTFSCHLHDNTLTFSIQTMGSKLLLNLIGSIIVKDREVAIQLLNRILEVFILKVENLASLRDEWDKWARPKEEVKRKGAEEVEEDKSRSEGDQEMDDTKVQEQRELDEVDLERRKPIGAVACMSADQSADALKDARTLLRNLIHALKAVLSALKHVHGPPPDAKQMGRLFISGMQCMSLFDHLKTQGDKGRSELKEVMEPFAELFTQTDLLIFQEIFENRMGIFLEEVFVNSELLLIAQFLLSHKEYSHAFVNIMLRFLVSLLPTLGNRSEATALVLVRFFKMCFMAVTIYPEANESTLLPHLTHIIMQSLKLAGQAEQPIHYYNLLRSLFRSIGGGRFETLYREVLPLLQVILEQLNALLNAADRAKRDLFVELCLTVPVRLSVLLPNLSYLMKPLVLALESGNELVTQGLRTLELCVDNLTQEFLNPLMAPVINDVMLALWKLLKPLPANQHFSHQTLRILGKIGGRNRHILGPIKIKWQPSGEQALIPIHLAQSAQGLPMKPVADLAARTLKRGDLHYRQQAFDFFKHAAVVFMTDSLTAGEPEETFHVVLLGLLECTRIEELKAEATPYMSDLVNLIFSTELTREVSEPGSSKQNLPLSSALLEALTENLACTEGSDLVQAIELTRQFLESLIASPDISLDSSKAVLRQLATRLASVCYEQAWSRKTGAAAGLKLLTSDLSLEFNTRWCQSHELEIVRALLFMLKDTPLEAPLNVQEASETLLHVMRNSITVSETSNDASARLKYMVSLLIVELSSQTAIVRDTSKAAIQILADSLNIPIAQLLASSRDRLLGPIFGKPLRALGFPMQIGNIDAITYCISLDPPLLDFESSKASDQSDAASTPSSQSQANATSMETSLSRVLVEALGIADADDQALAGRNHQQKNATLLTKLRVVCVKMLSAAMATSEFSLPRQSQTRMRILSVYFKLLYSRSSEVVDAAYDALHQVTIGSGKLPKELLQSGLRPVLMNLADHRKLTVPSLEGLAKLLALLTSYFRVEIGHKLLDHFRAISSDVTTLTHAALNPQNENSELAIMAGIVHIFRLLPHPASAVFLEQLCQLVTDVETSLKKAGPTQFTIPLARYLDRYPEATVEFFFVRIVDDPSYARTFYAILSSKEAPNLRDHLIEQVTTIFPPLFGEDPRPPPIADEVPRRPWRAALHGAELILCLLRDSPPWVADEKHNPLVGALLQRWISTYRVQRLLSEGQDHLDQVTEDAVLLDVFLAVLKQKPDIDLLFHMASVYTFRTTCEHIKLSRFYYEDICKSTDVAMKRRILERWIDLIETSTTSVTAEHKAAALQHFINPMLDLSFSRGAAEISLLDSVYIDRLHSKLWQPALNNEWREKWLRSEALKIELLRMTTLIVSNRPKLIADRRKDVIKFGWVNNSDHDITVSQAAFALIAAFLTRYESPAKFILHVYSNLLKSHTAEARTLVRDALDELAPALLVRGSHSADSNPPSWIKTTRQILLEDGHNNVSQLIHIYSFIVRHSELFYARRDLFIAHIAGSMPKLVLSASASFETRTLAADLYATILSWENQRIKIQKAEEGKMDVDNEDDMRKRGRVDRSGSAAASSTVSSAQNYSIPLSMRENLLTFLIKAIIASSDASLPRDPAARDGTLKDIAQRKQFVDRGMILLKEFLSPEVWSDISIKLPPFQMPLIRSELTEASLPTFISALEILKMVVSFKSDEWVAANIIPLQKLLEKTVLANESQAHRCIAPLLQRMFSIYPDSKPDEEGREPSGEAPTSTIGSADEGKTLFAWSSATIEEGLRGGGNGLQGAILLLQCITQSQPSRLEAFFIPLGRVLTRLLKEHLGGNTTEASSPEACRTLLEDIIRLLRLRVADLGEQRRWYLSSLIQIVEKSPSTQLCRIVLDVIRHWVLIDRALAHPVPREKATILSKMMSFERRDDPTLYQDFLSLIYDIYSDPTFARSELTVRLEHAFLLGCRDRDPAVRGRFLDLFDRSISTSLYARLHYIVGVQSWEALGETIWIHQALDLLLGSADQDQPLFQPSARYTAHPAESSAARTVLQLSSFKSRALLSATRKLVYADANTTQSIWIAAFKTAWECLGRKEQHDINRYMIVLLSKEYHLGAVDRRPNNIQMLLGGLLACSPTPSVPPHLVRYLGRTFNAWHISAELLQDAVAEYREEQPQIQESTLDALAELYSDLSEDDLFYGLWRRRSFYPETNIAISFEQAGMWAQAQQMYEAAQIKARTGVMPFTESEYAVWEDHWVNCATKLQQWDILTELARHEGNSDLMLECNWRLADWFTDREKVEEAIEHSSNVPTPRRRVFEAYLALVKSNQSEDRKPFIEACNSGIELALRKWYYLPEVVSAAHVPLFQVFQQFVELQEAGLIFTSLAATNAGNLDQRSVELKSILITWRERLPNAWDDINIWSDLVSWRQHVFGAINKCYLPLLPHVQPAPNGAPNANSLAYRGYHETAWIINRFAHVARQHQLSDVCIGSLTKIYTLPNIEIQEAFLKLREQAKCHYQNPGELTAGLEVINNTNLAYFGPSQKAEFYTLKGMFLARLGMDEEANQVFNSAVSLDMGFGKAWAHWGEYHDRQFSANPSDLSLAANAVGCYLHAAGIYKSAKVRKLLVRILWLLSLDDSNGTVAKAFDTFKGELPTWYWITFIPQLLLSLSHREARYARLILNKIARTFPQALFFQLRTNKEELVGVKAQFLRQAEARRNAGGNSTSNGLGQSASSSNRDQDTEMGGSFSASPSLSSSAAPSSTQIVGPNGQMLTMPAPTNQNGTSQPANQHRQPWEYVEEIGSLLKTAFPLLALTLETIGDQIQARFKPQNEEDVYRIISALSNDALQQYILRGPDHKDNQALLPVTLNTVQKFAEGLPDEPKPQFTNDFVTNVPTLRQYVLRLQQWRDRYEKLMDRRNKRQPLELASHWLVEFQYHKFDDIEVPGQYLKDEDTVQNFVRVSHFQSKFDFIRQGSGPFRRLTIVGHDGSLHPFAVQYPANRSSRREERIVQFFRLLNGPLAKHKESRKRNLQFDLPVAVPITPSLRLVEHDASVTTLQDVYERYCKERNMGKDDPIMGFVEKLRELSVARDGIDANTMDAAKLEVFQEMSTKIFPDDIFKKYMIRSMATPGDLWHVRKQMTTQFASFIFTTYIFSVGMRTPGRMSFSRSSGNLYTTDLLPSFKPNKAEFGHSESVPFRFTPNLQKFFGAIGTEGVLSSSLLAISRALTEIENDLEHRSCVFVREEMVTWHQLQRKSTAEPALRESTVNNVKAVVQRANLLACKLEREKTPVGSVPATQTITELLSAATNPQKLATLDPLLLPWL